MRLGEGVEWAVHCTTLLALLPGGATLTSAQLAEFHGVPGPYLAKSLQALSRAGVVGSEPGRGGGYRLARRPEEVSLLEVVEAVEGAGPSFRCSEIRRRGPARVDGRHYAPVCAVARAMHRADDAWRRSLATTTLADLLATMARTVPAEALEKAAAWCTAALA